MKQAVVILAGGTGTRLWPLSRNKKPKQFTSLINENSLLRNAYDRLLKAYEKNDIFISTNTQFKELVEKELPELEKKNIIFEPAKRDRTAAFGLIALKLEELGYQSIILIAADEYIGDVNEFLRVLKLSAEINEKHPDQLLIMGANPTYPNTGLGYIEMGEPSGRFGKDIIFNVESFKEKPDLKTAEKFVNDWRYLWNAGWFIFNTNYILEKYKELVPETYEYLKKCFNKDPFSKEFAEEYSKCEAITFDIAITEKLKNVIVLPISVGWVDIGSWNLVRDILAEDDAEKNICIGEVKTFDSEGNLVYSSEKKKQIVLIGIDKTIVIETPDALLISSMEKSQEIKNVLKDLPEEYL